MGLPERNFTHTECKQNFSSASASIPLVVFSCVLWFLPLWTIGRPIPKSLLDAEVVCMPLIKLSLEGKAVNHPVLQSVWHGMLVWIVSRRIHWTHCTFRSVSILSHNGKETQGGRRGKKKKNSIKKFWSPHPVSWMVLCGVHTISHLGCLLYRPHTDLQERPWLQNAVLV